MIARLRPHQSSLFECVRGISAEVFGVVGEAEAVLFDCVGREIAEGSGVGN
ncbi:hypothetical protein [Nostoc sp. MG11]|uniref:hypothetical protein n=1 Tax=Nostoc sp. MG11 TaxID=2721166 RepID=UPI0018694F7E|nr:hypothetical protein [Nostoc sp. MG11]